MKILHATPTFYPAVYWGGPIFSTYALCNALAAISSVRLKVVLTADSAGAVFSQRDSPASNPVVYQNSYEVRFTRRIWGQAMSPGQLMLLPNMIRWVDIVHLTGTYLFPTLPTLLPARVLSRSRLWSLRGALQRWDGPTQNPFWKDACGKASSLENCPE